MDGVPRAIIAAGRRRYLYDRIQKSGFPLNELPNNADCVLVGHQSERTPKDDRGEHERRTGTDRRKADRRKADRRSAEQPVAVERRVGNDRRKAQRRSGTDRRSG